MTNPAARLPERTRGRRVLLLALALVAVLVLALLAAPSADAGTYRAVQCHEQVGAGRADASFARTSDGYLPAADCAGRGLGITTDPGARRIVRGRHGSWTLRAPPGAELIRAVARVRAARDGGHAPRVAVLMPGGAQRKLAGVPGEERHPVGWTGTGGRALTARLVCERRRWCRRAPGAHIHLRHLSFGVRDVRPPTLALAGSLLAPGSRRGAQGLTVTAGDTGSGVRTITLDVNGSPIAARTLRCRLSGPVAVRLRPCPAEATAGFDLRTTDPDFRQGPNLVRVCVADYAPRGAANRRCAERIVRVDNRCPVSAIRGARLHARLPNGERQRTRSDRTTRLTGALTDAAGEPVMGARVCVAAQVVPGVLPERVVATPLTDSDGRFEVRLPAGPSRRVRVAHWPEPERAVERFLALEARAIPRLRLRPRRTLHNGDRVRFRVGIPGPANGRRAVAVEARAGGHWIRIAGGRTAPDGRWRGSYRFRSTTGTRRYTFRAIVRRQPGYPYRAGRSRARHVRVRG